MSAIKIKNLIILQNNVEKTTQYEGDVVMFVLKIIKYKKIENILKKKC